MRDIWRLDQTFPWQLKAKNISPPKPVGRFSNKFVENLMFLGGPFIRFLQAMLIGRKTWPSGSWAVLPYMAIVNKFEKQTLQKNLAAFQRIL